MPNDYRKRKADFEQRQERGLDGVQSIAGREERDRLSGAKIPFGEAERMQKEEAEANKPGLMDELSKMWDTAFEGSKEPPVPQGNSKQYTNELNKIKDRSKPAPKDKFNSAPQSLSMNEPEVELDENGEPIKMRKDLLSKVRMPV